jgi:hypothetical protein
VLEVVETEWPVGGSDLAVTRDSTPAASPAAAPRQATIWSGRINTSGAS